MQLSLIAHIMNQMIREQPKELVAQIRRMFNTTAGDHTTGIYYPGSSPEGSSSGSWVATFLGLAFAAIGTEVVRFCRLEY